MAKTIPENKYIKGKKTLVVDGKRWRVVDLLRLTPNYDPFRDAEGAWFETETAQLAIDFFENCLKFVEGADCAGKPFVLQPWQASIVCNLLAWKKEKTKGTNTYVVRRYREVFLYVPRKNGKMLSLDTPIPTLTGWKLNGEIKTGDLVLGPDGVPVKVLKAHSVQTPDNCYEVCFSNGEKIKACGDHLWETTAKVVSPGIPTDGMTKRPKTAIRSTEEIRATLTYSKREDFNHTVRMPEPVDLPEQNLSIDPYMLGFWLGDGDKDCARVTLHKDDYAHAKTEFPFIGPFRPDKRNPNTGRATLCKQQSKLKHLLHNKHIPLEYLRASYNQRLALLQGLMDTDGSCSKAGQCEFGSSCPKLVSQVEELLSTFGIKYTTKWRTTVGKDAARISFFTTLPVFRMERKKANLKTEVNRAKNVTITAVNPISPEPMRCLTVEGGLYLCGKTMLPTHNTPLVAALMLYVLFMDNEPAAQIYSAAGDRDQAAVIYRHARMMIEGNKYLEAASKIYTTSKSIETPKNGGLYKALSSEAATKHGLNVHMGIIEELHAHKTSDLTDTIETGRVSRLQPIMFYVTTADYDRPSICNDKYDYAKAILDPNSEITHETRQSVLPVIYELPEDADIYNEDNWITANPNLGVSVDKDSLRAEVDKTRIRRSYLNVVKRLHFNIKTSNQDAAFNMEQWDNVDAWKYKRKKGISEEPFNSPKEWRDYWTEALRYETCYGGLDLSSTDDITALALWFPDYNIALPYFWTPEHTIRQKMKKANVPYDAWGEDGFINATDGEYIDVAEVHRQIEELYQTYNIAFIGFDRWQAYGTYGFFENEGIKCGMYGQGFKEMTAPYLAIEKMLGRQELNHGGNPVLRWMANNSEVVTNHANMFRFQKPEREQERKIDGITALAMAIGTHYAIIETDGFALHGLRSLVENEDSEHESMGEVRSDEEILDDFLGDDL